MIQILMDQSYLTSLSSLDDSTHTAKTTTSPAPTTAACDSHASQTADDLDDFLIKWGFEPEDFTAWIDSLDPPALLAIAQGDQ